MSKASRNRFRSHASPTASRRPLFIRLCEEFVDNLSLILRGLFLLGALALAQDMRLFSGGLEEPAENARTEVIPPGAEPADTVGEQPADEPVVTDRIRDALACTYKDYRDSHYDECVDGGSLVYDRPLPEGSGFLTPGRPVQLAALQGPGNDGEIR